MNTKPAKNLLPGESFRPANDPRVQGFRTVESVSASHEVAYITYTVGAVRATMHTHALATMEVL